MVRVAVDAMGGDLAPHAVVKGAQAAHRENLAEVVLVGDEGRVRPLLEGGTSIEIIHAATSVEMDESPSTVLRRKKDSSINVAFQLLKAGKVDAVVSAGNSGAIMAFGIFTLGRISGVERPAIMTMNPSVKGGIASVLIDAGGNVDCKPTHLGQFAILGNVFARYVLGIESPRIGLLSNGEEETKGNELTRDANAILKTMGLNYIGYVEGTDLHNGSTDVVVTDGFVGNVALKTSEGTAEVVIRFLKDGIRSSLRRKLGYLLMADVFRDLARAVDYAEYGGAPLLGVDGVSIICHGKSNERAIKNAVRLAAEFVEKGLNVHMNEAMEQHSIQNKSRER
jgi:glycerol-3-phosphate acyltransferase PlsX